MASASLDFRHRDKLFAALDGQSFDLLVIGGGVTGAGVARDGAMRGLSVALVEARDFASGTSSRSSKMIHGGLRYLPQGDIALVREAASERKAVEAIAPHLARRTPFVMPARSQAAIARLRAGLWTFEKLGAVPGDRRHQVWSPDEVAECEPAIDRTDLAGAVVYPEYLTEDARLTLANVRGARAAGAVAASYARVDEIILENGRAVGARIVEAPAIGDRTARVFARAIVNAAGPWVDALRALEATAAPPRLRLTRGVHLVVARTRLPVNRTVIMSAADRRGVFAVPKGAFTYVGTTDTFHDGADYWPPIRPADVAYLLAACATRFSSPPLNASDVVSAWSGLRPLVAEEGKSASDISRRDEVWQGPGGVLSIAGGKLTAYRKMAERIVDRVETALDRKHVKCATATTPLPGGDVDAVAAEAALRARGLDDIAAQRLVGLYGSEAASLAEAGGGPAIEARHAVLHEGALTLEDYWVRRSGRAWFDHEGGMEALAPAAAEMAGLIGWSSAETARQVETCRRIHHDTLASLTAPATSEPPPP
jgi:glycerol-3-phosphate dehydrogenase